MRRREPPLERTVLRKCWRRWTGIVELFARRRAGRHRVDPQDYVALHLEVIDRCRALGASADEEEAAFYRRAEDLARPWLNLDVLTRAEREILFDLIVRCRGVEAQLTHRSPFRSFLTRGMPFLLATLFFVNILLWSNGILVFLKMTLYHARDWSDRLWYRVSSASDLQWMLFLGCALLGISAYLLSRPARS
jgi:hypothetical protein